MAPEIPERRLYVTEYQEQASRFKVELSGRFKAEPGLMVIE
jgi:hypothetical protein